MEPATFRTGPTTPEFPPSQTSSSMWSWCQSQICRNRRRVLRCPRARCLVCLRIPARRELHREQLLTLHRALPLLQVLQPRPRLQQQRQSRLHRSPRLRAQPLHRLHQPRRRNPNSGTGNHSMPILSTFFCRKGGKAQIRIRHFQRVIDRRCPILFAHSAKRVGTHEPKSHSAFIPPQPATPA